MLILVGVLAVVWMIISIRLFVTFVRLCDKIDKLTEENRNLKGCSPKNYQPDAAHARFWVMCQSLFEAKRVDNRWEPGPSAANLYKHYKNMPAFKKTHMDWVKELVPVVAAVAKEHFDKALPPVDAEIDFDSEGNIKVRRKNVQ